MEVNMFEGIPHDQKSGWWSISVVNTKRWMGKLPHDTFTSMDGSHAETVFANLSCQSILKHVALIWVGFFASDLKPTTGIWRKKSPLFSRGLKFLMALRMTLSWLGRVIKLHFFMSIAHLLAAKRSPQRSASNLRSNHGHQNSLFYSLWEKRVPFSLVYPILSLSPGCYKPGGGIHCLWIMERSDFPRCVSAKFLTWTQRSVVPSLCFCFSTKGTQ